MPDHIAWADRRLDQIKGAGIIGFILGFGFLISGLIGTSTVILGLGGGTIFLSGVVYVGAHAAQKNREGSRLPAGRP